VEGEEKGVKGDGGEEKGIGVRGKGERVMSAIINPMGVRQLHVVGVGKVDEERWKGLAERWAARRGRRVTWLVVLDYEGFEDNLWHLCLGYMEVCNG
jgi:hypothetical protein